MMTDIHTRRGFLFGAGSFGLAAAATAGDGSARFDASLTVVMSDIHTSGKGVTGPSGVQPTYQNPLFMRAVNEVLAMRPLPKRVVILGDISLWVGHTADYEAAKTGVDRLKAAGIEVYLTAGNHDHRAPMARVFPECAARSRVEGRFSTVVDLGPADLFLIDSLQENPKGEGAWNPVGGEVGEAQGTWLAAEVKAAKRPFFAAAHHPLRELTFNGEPLSRLLVSSPYFGGYIYGHNHRWEPRWNIISWKSRRLYRSSCVPSTGWWGDIGYTTLRTYRDHAVLTNIQKDFFFPRQAASGEKRPPTWDDIVAANDGAKCVFRFDANS